MSHEQEIKWLQDRLELSEQSSLSMVRLVACKAIEMSGLQAEIERLRDTAQSLTDDVEQYIMEVRHAQSNGASWYSQGAKGLYGHIRHATDRMWEQTKIARAALQPKENDQ